MTPAEALDRMDQISTCLRCLADLLVPEADLHVVNRDDLSVALGFLVDEYRQARDTYGQHLALARERSASVT